MANEIGIEFDLLDVAKIFKETPLYILAWSTTPWTLPSNTALTVGAKINYIIIETFNEYTLLPIRVLLAKDLVDKYFNKKYTLVTVSYTHLTLPTSDLV